MDELERLEAERDRLTAESRRLHAELLRIKIREALLVELPVPQADELLPMVDRGRWVAAWRVMGSLSSSVRSALGELAMDLEQAKAGAHGEGARRARESARLLQANGRLGQELDRLVSESGETRDLRRELDRRHALGVPFGRLADQVQALEALGELADFEGVDGLEFQVMRAQLEVDTSLALLAAEESLA